MMRKCGYCLFSGIVTLAAGLLDRDPGFQDFVTVHDLLYLREFNHGKLFEALMSLHVPDWRLWDLRLE